MKKLIITEEQLAHIRENTNYDRILKTAVNFIDLNYATEVGTYRQGGEYFEKPMIHVKADDNMIPPKELLSYLKYKFGNLSDAFLRQVILDWCNGKIPKNGKYKLSKNVALG